MNEETIYWDWIDGTDWHVLAVRYDMSFDRVKHICLKHLPGREQKHLWQRMNEYQKARQNVRALRMNVVGKQTESDDK